MKFANSPAPQSPRYRFHWRLVRRSWRTAAPRRGLAPLELVLSLPLLLMVMALMIDFGTAASWKVRSAMVARDAVWSNRWPRSGLATAPQPANWPMNAGQAVQAGAVMNMLNNASIDQPVARGPTLDQCTVNRNLLDPTQGLQLGTSAIQRPMPLLPSLPSIQFNLTDPLLSNGWQYQRMGMYSNTQLREPIIYQFAQPSNDLVVAYQNAVAAVWFSPLQAPLAVLFQDQEIFNYYGGYRNFYPQLQGFCSLDVNSVHQNNVQQLIYQIQGRKKPHVAGVPETMGRFFIGMYQSQLQNLKNQMQQPGADVAALQAQMQPLQETIQKLQQFVNGPAQKAAL